MNQLVSVPRLTNCRATLTNGISLAVLICAVFFVQPSFALSIDAPAITLFPIQDARIFSRARFIVS